MFGEHRFNREVRVEFYSLPMKETGKIQTLKVKVEEREYTVSTDPAEWAAVER